MSTELKARILLVDDQPKNLAILEHILEEEGYDLVRAGSGAEALRELLLKDFAVIVLDVLMPGLSGFETAKLIQQRARSRLVPIIFLTAYQKNELDVVDGYTAGAVDFLSKPVDPIVLRSKIAVFVKLFRQREELRLLNEALSESQRGLCESNGRLQEAVRTLSDNNAMLDSFAYSISHDLRTPLRHAIAFSSLLHDSCKDKLSAEELRLLGTVREGTKRMSHMIDDLLAFCRISRGGMSKGVIDMQALVREVIRDLQPSTAGRNIRFIVDSLPAAEGDYAMLRQVWVNLLSNSIKYTGKRELAEIHIGCSDAAKGKAYFVKDNGAGFDMAHAKRLFGVFQRMHTEAEFEGTGAGLAIVKRIIERHDGQLTAEAQVDVGATFTFTLP